jgi:hypothetical protein
VAKEKAQSESSVAVAEPENEKVPLPVLFSVGCMFGRAGIGAESGSISVKFPDGVLSDFNRGYFIQNTLLVTLSSNPTPPNSRERALPGTEDEFETRTLTVSARRISVGQNDVGVTLTFDKGHVSADFLSLIAARSGSLIVHEVVGAK